MLNIIYNITILTATIIYNIIVVNKNLMLVKNNHKIMI